MDSSLPRWAATATPPAWGGAGSSPTACPACETRRARAARLAFPPEQRATVIAPASELPDRQGCPATRRTPDELAARLVNEYAAEAAGRSTAWRIPRAAGLKPHRSAYRLDSHGPDFAAIARAACRLYVRAPALARQGHPVLSTDEKSGMQVLQRLHPTRRAFLSGPGYPFRFVYLPKHGSWLSQGELFFSVPARRFLRRGDFASAAESEARLGAFLADYNGRHARPYRWTYTGEPLVRGTPFSQTRRQQQQGRARFGTHRQRYARFLHPPRPYRRHAA
jgi:hypothetical protein